MRRGNPPGVLWVICWCGTWAVKHPGALQEHRVTVTLSSFTVASASANRPALPLRRLHVETITEQTPLQLYLLWYLIRFVWLLFRLSAFGFCPFFIFSAVFSSKFLLCLCIMCFVNECRESEGITLWEKHWVCLKHETEPVLEIDWDGGSEWSSDVSLISPLKSTSVVKARCRRRGGGRLKTEFLSPRIFQARIVKLKETVQPGTLKHSYWCCVLHCCLCCLGFYCCQQ